MTVVLYYGLFFFCFVIYVHRANLTFCRNFIVRANFLYILHKNAVPSFCAECQTFLTTVSRVGHTLSYFYLYMEGTKEDRKNEQ